MISFIVKHRYKIFAVPAVVFYVAFILTNTPLLPQSIYSPTLMIGALLFYVIVGYGILGLILLLFSILRSSHKVEGIIFSSYLMFCVLPIMVIAPVSDHLTNYLFSRVIIKAKPIVNALEQYKKDNNIYPDSLEALVPDYLNRLPTTGLGQSPVYEYHNNSICRRHEAIEKKSSCYETIKERGGYSLYIRGLIFMTSYDLFYYPSENYPDYYKKRIKNWAIYYD